MINSEIIKDFEHGWIMIDAVNAGTLLTRKNEG
jgi:hypothetical protein